MALADNTYDQSYKDLQNCEASSGTNTKVITRVGISTSVIVDGIMTPALPGTCPSDIIWFDEENGGFTLITLPRGTIDYGREDVVNNSTIKQTTAGQLTITKTFGIKGDHNSGLIQMLRNIEMADGINGHDGKLLQAYSNGGYHFELGVEYLDSGMKVSQLCLNCKIATSESGFAGFVADDEISFELLIEFSPHYIVEGDYKAGLGLNDNGLDCVEATTVVEDALVPGQITISPSLTITDTNQILGPTPSYNWYAINTSTGCSTIASGHVTGAGKASDAVVIADGGVVDDVIKINYFYVKDQMMVAAATEEVVVTLAP